MPGRVKRYFPNYIFFSALTGCYPDVLPLSAHNIRYYSFDLFYIDQSGYKATLSKADYEKLKARQWNIYSTGLSNEHHLHDGVNKLYINRDDLKQNKIDFIDELLPLEEDDGNYYFLAYSLCDVDNYYLYSGVICNDEKNEILEFSCYFDGN